MFFMPKIKSLATTARAVALVIGEERITFSRDGRGDLESIG